MLERLPREGHTEGQGVQGVWRAHMRDQAALVLGAVEAGTREKASAREKVVEAGCHREKWGSRGPEWQAVSP